MPSGYTIDVSRRIVLQSAWGIVRGARLVDHDRMLGADPNFDPSFMAIGDLRRVSEILASSADIRRLVKSSPFGAGSRRVVLASSDEAFGLSRMFELLRDGRMESLYVTRDFDDALRWLGVVQHKAAILSALDAPPMVTTDA